MTKNNSTVLKCAAAVLIALYAVSFIPAVRGGNSEQFIQSALLNKKYENTLTEILISQEGSMVRLFRRNETGVWEGERDGAVFPADNEQIGKLIDKLTKVRNMYKISDSRKKWENFALTDRSAVVFTYKNSDNMSTKIYFGGQNFDKTRRYLRTENRITSYEIDSDFDMFLTAKESFWYDPYILPRNVAASSSAETIQGVRINGIYYTKKSAGFDENCKKFTELRHGELSAVPRDGKQLYTIEAECGDGLYVHIRVYEAGEGKVLAYSFTDTLSGKEYDYNYAVTVSSWTFGRIEELFPPSRN